MKERLGRRLTEWMLQDCRGRGERAREGTHVTKCVLITEQQMSRMELLCCLNSRTLHFSGLTSHRIHLPASCQFRVERVKGKVKERKRKDCGSHQSISPLPLHVLQRSCHFVPSFPRWPVQLAICITTHTSTHCPHRAGGGAAFVFWLLYNESLWTWLEARSSGTKLHVLRWMADTPGLLFPYAADLAGQR